MGRLRAVLGWVGVVGFVMPLVPFADPRVRTSLRVSVWQRPMMPLPGMVLTPQTLLTVAGLALGVLCWLVYGILWMRDDGGSDETDGRRAAAGRPWKAPRILARAVVALTVLCGVTAAGFTLLFTDGYHVLAPRGAGGCAVVVSVDAGGMFDAGGEVYLKRPDSPWLMDTGGVWYQRNDPGADPIDDGSWSLVWRGRRALLDIRDTTAVRNSMRPRTPPPATNETRHTHPPGQERNPAYTRGRRIRLAGGWNA